MSGLSVDLHHELGDFTLDVTLTAPKGVTGIIGPSGAGKSMLLKMIAGLERPQRGNIFLDDGILTDTWAKVFIAPERRRIGYVFQDALLFPHLSVAENLDYGTKRRGATGIVSRDDVIAMLGLEHLITRRPHHLSGGEAQRVAIGRALLSNPQLLLMDEPLSSLDPRRRKGVMPFIETLHQNLDLPIVYVSHNIEEITRLADRVVVIHGGTVAALGNVAAVLNRPDIQQLIHGNEGDDNDPAMIVEAIVESHDETHHTTRLDFGGTPLSLPIFDCPIGEMVRLRIHARDVAIATSPPNGISIQNVIEARVADIMRVSAGQVEVTMALSDAYHLKARITERASETLALTEGMQVWALIKSVALSDSGQN